MGPLRWFLFVYVLGGVTFVPLLVIAVIAIVYYTSPEVDPSAPKQVDNPTDITREDDETLVLKSGTDDLAEKFHRKHDSDVAAGYFAVCREYVPGGVNGKPPDKLSPAGEVVANESPSVYQTMYRSIFDRSQKPSIEPNKDGAGKNVKRSNNIFYVVLRHGHLMLYDDIQQLEVRYVISLDYHDVDIYAGKEDEIIPEGELWVKRHAIRLKRKQSQPGDRATSLPFFLFSENTSEKEDFYIALLKNQRRSSEEIPEAEEFEVKHIVNLVQKLHSSEEYLATRWLNALIGRLFLAIYKTEELEDFIRSKLMKKLSRVKKPNFITRLALQKMDMGTSGPLITNPRLRDLTVDGDCTIEADVHYTGNFRLEVGATARIDLGTRFKAREVDLVLAITVKKVHGRALLRFKPPPSNRIWVTFEKMPQLDLAVEPIVSTRQITLTVVLRAIESRIREVLAESLVLPFWDDIPFFRTEGQKYRGGIWKRQKEAPTSVEIKSEEPEDEAEAGPSGTRTPDSINLGMKEDRNMSMPVLADLKKLSADKKTATSLTDVSGLHGKPPATPPRILHSSSFASAADPMVTPNHVDSDAAKPELEASRRDSATSFLKDLSARSTPGSASGSQAGTPPVESSIASGMKGRSDSLASKSSSENIDLVRQATTSFTTTPRTSITELTPTTTQTSRPSSRSASRPSSIYADIKPENQTFAQAAKSLTSGDRKQAFASAQQAAQKWSTIGWGVLARNRQGQNQSPEDASGNRIPSSPMGRGQPLPPPGQPLPRPQKQTTIGMVGSMLPKRKPVLPKRPDANVLVNSLPSSNGPRTPTTPKPPLPDRRRRQSSRADLSLDDGEDEVLVVEAPTESTPTSPTAERTDISQDDFFGHGEDEMPVADSTRKDSDPISDASTTSTNDQALADPTSLSKPIKTSLAVPPDLPARSPPPPYSANGTSNGDTNGNKEPPPLPQRSAPPSPSASIKRKPLTRAMTGESIEGRPISPEAHEARMKESSLSYMEAASGGGGYNE